MHRPVVPRSSTPLAEDVVDRSTTAQLEAFVDQHRLMLTACLDGLKEQQARRRLVPSATTLLGLAEHATFVERVGFDEAVTCRSREEIGLGAGLEEPFVVHPADTVASVQETHLAAYAASRRATAALDDLDDLVHGNRRGPLPLRWVYLHVLLEPAHHCGHAHILREQLLAGPAGAARGVPAGDR